MSQPAASAPRDEQLDEILTLLLEDSERGSGADPDDWRRRYPDFAAEITEFFHDSARLETVLKALRTPPGPTLPARMLERGERFGAYEILGEIARGGMGIVYEARQVALQRVVALKMILSGHLAGPEERQRFRLEAETVAALDHPHIVPVYEVGEHDGWLFFSMKHIDGGNLAGLELPRPLTQHAQRRVAALMATVADAVNHAHRHGLLHRDLKPANILLDRDGNALVTDFGLAKRVQAGGAEAATPSGVAVGTPSYMAPEQALRPREATTVADIYSLGCVLYELLTSRPPFRAETPLATLLEVIERQPEKPRVLCPTLDRDLETICLKCLQPEPDRRYGSAADLAADLRRFVHGEPVLARTTGIGERLLRRCRRRPLAASLLGSLLTLAVAAFALIAWQWRRAETNFALAQDKTVEAEQLAQAADANRRLAEQRFELALALVDEFCVRLSEDRLKDIPGTQAVRRDLLEKSRGYLQNFVRASGDEPRLRLRLAEARYALALVLGSLGARQDARRELDAVVQSCDELRRADATNERIQATLARALHRLGLSHAANAELAQALAYCRRGQALFAQLAARQPQDLRAQNDLAEAGSQLGNIHRLRAERAEALACLEASLASRRRVLAMKPTDPTLQFSLATTCFNYAGVLSDLERRRDALALLAEAHNLCEQLLVAHPGDPLYQRELATVLLVLGEDERLSGDLERSLSTVTRARDILEKLANANPQVVRVQQELAAVERELGHYGMTRGNKSDARSHYAAARDRLEPLVREHADLPDLCNDLAKCWYDLSVTFGTSRPQREECYTALERARRLREKVVQAYPEHRPYRHDLALTLGNAATAAWNLDRHDDALAVLERAVREDQTLLQGAPQVVVYRQSLGRNLGKLAGWQWRTGRHDAALANVEKRAELWSTDAAGLYEAARELGQFILNRREAGSATAEAQKRSADLALDLLRRAVKVGFRNAQALAEDRAFVTLRKHAEFQAILAELR